MKKKIVYARLLFFILLLHTNLYPISMVYNFRIAQITKQPIHEEDGTVKNHTLIALAFEQAREKRNHIFQNYAGGLGSYIYDFKPYYFRIDGAFSNIKEVKNGLTTLSGTETDDVLFTAGRNFIINKKTRWTFSGLFGIPTHRIYTLQHSDFGFSQIGLGIQFDGGTELDRQAGLLYGARYIHFVPRKALDSLNVPHTFTIGNIADLLIAYKNNWDKKHGIESGYTLRFRFGAHISPNLDDIVKKTNYIRSNFYIVYKYRFIWNDTYNRILYYLSYGFDHKPRLYGNKYIVTLWVSWNISF
jgi:hypothetical protein